VTTFLFFSRLERYAAQMTLMRLIWPRSGFSRDRTSGEVVTTS